MSLLQAGLWFRTARMAVLILEEHGIVIKKDLEMLLRVEGRTTVIPQVKHQGWNTMISSYWNYFPNFLKHFDFFEINL